MSSESGFSVLNELDNDSSRDYLNNTINEVNYQQLSSINQLERIE